jgi:NTE family protein
VRTGSSSSRTAHRTGGGGQRKTKVAIACQGGGSQTAFTAGALEELFEAGIERDFEIVSLSGTSGGAVCATLVWYALQKREQPVQDRLSRFWKENEARTGTESVFNDSVVRFLRAVNQGLWPTLQFSPYSPVLRTMLGYLTVGQRKTFFDFRELLKAHIDFDEIAAWGPMEKRPVLLLGAANVLSGKLRKFNSRREVIRVEHLLASCAVPSIFPAVEIDGGAYWDGLFSDNPPVDELIRPIHVGKENLPEEIWVIKINPTKRETVPQQPDDIIDRRNQLEGNVSLFQQLTYLEMLNDLIIMKAFRPEFLNGIAVSEPFRIPKCFAEDDDKPYHIPCIEMSAELQRILDYEGKIDRAPKHLGLLIEEGRSRAREFLDARGRRVKTRPQGGAVPGDWFAAPSGEGKVTQAKKLD